MDDIKTDVQRFLDNNGVVTKVPAGVSGLEFNPNRTRAEFMAQEKARISRKYYEQKNAVGDDG